MPDCIICGKSFPTLSKTLPFCHTCLKNSFEEIFPAVKHTHAEIRQKLGLPPYLSISNNGMTCTRCVNQCKIQEGKIGYCGSYKNENGKLEGIYKEKTTYFYKKNLISYMLTKLCQKRGCSKSKEAGGTAKNLGIMYWTCNYNCLSCRNVGGWEKLNEITPGGLKIESFIDEVDENVECVGFFGGDPVAQIDHAFKCCEYLINKKNKIPSICWETNGAMNSRIIRKMAEYSYLTKGCIRLDLKTFNDNLHIALTGSSNKWTFKNVEILADISRSVKTYKFLTLSTLLMPGYVENEEVSAISRFIASIDKSIPYRIIKFLPGFYLNDIPETSSKDLLSAKEVAQNQGLNDVEVIELILKSNEPELWA
ncbi:radical SAM protein [Candidatus Margulisiibacteriota bacterium]